MTDDAPAGLLVREAVPADAPHIAALLTQLGYPATSEEVSQRLAYWLPAPASLVLIAERDARVAGCLSLHAIPYLERTGYWARIESLVVDQPARGSGTGRALVAAAEEAARRWGCLRMEVTSSRHRAGAHAFYRHLGYLDRCDQSGRFLKPLS